MAMQHPPPLFAQATHIAIVMHDFSNGGTERIAIRLANRWARTGRRVSILCGTAEGPARALVDPGVAVIAVWPEIRRSPLSRFALGRAFAECVGLLQPDLLFVPGNFHILVIATLAHMLGADRPAIICKLSNPLRRPGRAAPFQWLFEAIIRRMTGAVDGFVAMSAALADEARQVLRRPEVRLIHEPNIDESYRPPRGTGQRDGRTILCAGRLVPQKNFELAIQAFARIDPAFDARLLILGDGETRLRLEILVDRLGLNERVTFGGHVPDIRPALARASLFLLSSRYEGYPAVLVEALAAGVPAVATACSPAMAEIMLDPSFGQVVPADPARLTAAMEKLLLDPWRQVDATRLIERHRVDTVGDRYLAFFDAAVQARQERGWPA
jgi:glycosyltransferase involved in cell wall biosynthesis